MSGDWMPHSRSPRIAMAKTWDTVIPGQAESWGIPEADVTELTEAYDEVNGRDATPPEQRTLVFNQMLQIADERLIAIMRKIKRLYLFPEIIGVENYLTLGLRLHDTEPTPVPVPVGTATAKVEYLSGQQIQLELEHATNISAEAKAYYGFRIYYTVLPADAPVPETEDALNKSVFTRRRRHIFRFTLADAGKRAHFRIVYENSKGESGPFGSIISALIP